MKSIKYVTGNWAKILSAKQRLEPLGYEVEQIKIDTVEIQADTIEEVAAYSAKWASRELGCAVLKNDSGICIDALSGFPGPYTHYVDDTLGMDNILKLMENEKNRDASFVEVLAYCEKDKEPVIFKSITKGHIALEKSGTYGWSWDFIFIPEGSDKTLGNYPDDVRFYYWNMDGYGELVKYLENK